MNKYRAAFTLVELSIVLVILGLLVGGVLTGQSLIRAAQLRSVSTDGSKFATATNAFRDKYFAIPGDMANATSFWGVLAGTGYDATCSGTAATGAPTCNGNGDGQVLSGASFGDERYRFWQHLANAGLIEGRYTGVYGTTPGTHIPGSKVDSNAIWGVFYNAAAPNFTNGSTNAFLRTSGNELLIYNTTSTAMFVPEEAWNIDTKIDDGLPGTGRLIAVKGTTGNCTTTTNIAPPADAGSVYALSYKSKECLGIYWVNTY